MIERKVRRLVVVLNSVESKEVLERWEFKVEYETEASDKTDEQKASKQKTEVENTNPNSIGKPKTATAQPPSDAAQAKPKYRDTSKKDEKQIKQEIRDVIRQITASVTFLPLLDCVCSFDILIYTDK